MIVIDRDSSQAGIALFPVAESTCFVARSDGNSFRLLAAGKPVSCRSAGRTQMSSIGFWYAHERTGSSPESVAVILRHTPKHCSDRMRQVEIVADRLAERLAKDSRLSAAYEFDGSRMVLKAY
jgi:hypothetical protein